MYPWVKALFASIIIVIVGVILFSFRGPIMALFHSEDSSEAVVLSESSVVVENKSAAVEPKGPVAVEPVKEVDQNISEKSPSVAVKPVVKTAQVVKDAQRLFEAKKYLEAKKLLLDFLKEKKLTFDDELFWQVMGVLTEINRIIVTTDFYTPDKIRHNIVPGDRLSKMAKTYQTTIQNINRSNGRDVNDSRIYVGKVFYIYPGYWNIKISKSKHKLVLYDKGVPFMAYDIADGRQNRTPVGKFKIKTKEVEPAWTAPGKNIPYGDPRNVLGSRWMGLEEQVPNSQNIGYGIHGTNDPSSIGTSASNGCIRMNNRDVEELYDILPYGVDVEIVE